MNLSELRQSMKARRAALTPPERQAAEIGLGQQLARYLDSVSGVMLPGALVCSFRTSDALHEISTRAVDKVLRERGLRVAYARTLPDPEQLLDFRVAPDWGVSEGWEPGYADILQPIERCPVAELRDIALVLVPGLVFGVDSGVRIGYGKGHYDRWFAHLDAVRQLQVPVPRVGLGYGFQIVPGVQPQAWDQTIDGVLTPEGWHPRS